MGVVKVKPKTKSQVKEQTSTYFDASKKVKKYKEKAAQESDDGNKAKE